MTEAITNYNEAAKVIKTQFCNNENVVYLYISTNKYANVSHDSHHSHKND